MSTGWSPFLSSSAGDAEENDHHLNRELEMLERAVQEQRRAAPARARAARRLQVLGSRPLRPGAPCGRRAGAAQPAAPRRLRPRALTGRKFRAGAALELARTSESGR